MTGDVGEKGEQVKTKCAFQQCCHSDCSFIDSSYVCRGTSFSEAEEEGGSSSLLIYFKCAVLKSVTVAVLHRLPSPSPVKTLPYDLLPHL